jgi:hypothetical protein
MTRMRDLARCAALLTTLLGCRSITGADEIRRERRLGVIAFYGDPVQIAAPDTVAVGAPAVVVVTTYGGGCISQGETEITAAGLVAEVRPYDYFVTRLPSNGACPDVLYVYEHVATLRFWRAGRATVRVVGREEPGNTPRTVERTIVVR